MVISVISLIYQSGSSLSTGIIMNDSGKWLHMLHNWLDLICPWLVVHGTMKAYSGALPKGSAVSRNFSQWAELWAVQLVNCLVEKLPWDKNIHGV